MLNTKSLCFALLALTLSILTACTPNSKSNSTPEQLSPQTVGIYDSRAIAIAYAGSPKHEQLLKSKREQLKKAEATGNQQKVEQAKQKFRQMQKQLHFQGFGTASVQNILDQYPQKLQALKTQLNLTHIISKWDTTTLDQYPNAKQVNITIPLIDILNPKPKQRKYAIQILNQKPIPNSRLGKLPVHD